MPDIQFVEMLAKAGRDKNTPGLQEREHILNYVVCLSDEELEKFLLDVSRRRQWITHS
jgi:hypothetical protein